MPFQPYFQICQIFVSWKSPSSAEIEKKNAMIFQIFSELHSLSSGLNLVRMVLTVLIQPLLQHTLFWAVLTEGGDHSLFLSSILPGTLPIPYVSSSIFVSQELYLHQEPCPYPIPFFKAECAVT